MTEDSRPKGISRREFARSAAIASAIAAIAPVAATAAPPKPPEGAKVAAADFGAPLPVTPALPPQAPGEPKLSPESRAEAEARLQTILAQYATRFSDEQKTDLRRLCFLAQPPLDTLRAYALENGDAPALYLKPLVEREKNPLENTRVGKTPSAVKKP